MRDWTCTCWRLSRKRNYSRTRLKSVNIFSTDLRELQLRHEIIRDVRGSGLFLGVELTKRGEPARLEAERVVNQMREQGILLGTDGPLHNVLKIRPPMPFYDADADLFLNTFGKILLELGRG